jgi:hypothetical protein
MSFNIELQGLNLWFNAHVNTYDPKRPVFSCSLIVLDHPNAEPTAKAESIWKEPYQLDNSRGVNRFDHRDLPGMDAPLAAVPAGQRAHYCTQRKAELRVAN